MDTFRECCHFPIIVAEMKDAQSQQHLLERLTRHPEVTVLLNGEIPSGLQGTYIKLLNQHGVTFKIVSNFVENNPDSLGLLLAERHTVDESAIGVTEKYSQAIETSREEPRAKKDFWQKLFYS